MHTETAILNKRLTGLENSQRRWQGLAILGIAGSIIPWVLGAAGTTEPTTDMRASSLSLVAPDGTEYAALKLEKGSPVLIMHQGDRHVQLTLADGNAGLACGGPAGVVFTGVSPDAAYFNARGSDLKTGVFAGVDSTLNGSFRAYASDLKVAATLDVAADGTPSLTLVDPKNGPSQFPAPVEKK